MSKKRSTKSIKLDRLKVSKQKHEIAYIKRRAKALKELCDEDIKAMKRKRSVVLFESRTRIMKEFSVKTIQKICKAAIKYL